MYPNMCAKCGCGPTVVSTKGGGGTDRQTDRQRDTVAVYSTCLTNSTNDIVALSYIIYICTS